MEILKEKTTGLCPVCYGKVGARVVVEDGKVVIEKTCPEHGPSRGVVEKDVSFYRKILSVTREKHPFIHRKGGHQKRSRDPYYSIYQMDIPEGTETGRFMYRTMMINLTHACNLSCKLCYLPDRDKAHDPPVEYIKEYIREYPGVAVSFSGGEPTLREDLPELITYARNVGKHACVLTNGIRMADWSLVQRLASAGLDLLNFSFNGLDEKAYLGIENARLLDIKLKAMENVKRAGIQTQLSFTMAPGVNEDQFGPIFQFARENPDFIYQIRARVSAGIGRSLGDRVTYLSDFISILANLLQVDREKLIDYWVRRATYPNPHLFNILLRDLWLQTGGDGKTTPEEIHPRVDFQFMLFSWPEVNTMDYEEIEGLDLDVLTRDGQVLNFWDGVIRNEKFGFL